VIGGVGEQGSTRVERKCLIALALASNVLLVLVNSSTVASSEAKSRRI
jgi:hypothetical protein